MATKRSEAKHNSSSRYGVANSGRKRVAAKIKSTRRQLRKAGWSGPIGTRGKSVSTGHGLALDPHVRKALAGNLRTTRRTAKQSAASRANGQKYRGGGGARTGRPNLGGSLEFSALKHRLRG